MKRFFSAGLFIILYLVIYYVLQFSYVMFATIYYMVSNLDAMDVEVVTWLEDKVPSAIVFSAAVAFLIYAFIVKVSKKKDIFEYCKFNPIPLSKIFILILAGLSILSLNIVILGSVSILFPESYEVHSDNMRGITSSGGVWMLFSIGLVAPFIEEVMFRGLITSELNKIMSYKWVLFIQALLFGIYHMNLVQGIYTFIIAIFMGLALHWTNSIWAPIIIHVVNNSITAIISNYIDMTSDVVSGIYGLWGIFSILFVLPITLKYLYKTRINWTQEDY